MKKRNREQYSSGRGGRRGGRGSRGSSESHYGPAEPANKAPNVGGFRRGKTFDTLVDVGLPSAPSPVDDLFVCSQCHPTTLISNTVNVSIRRSPKGGAGVEDVFKAVAMLDSGANTRNYISAPLAQRLIDDGVRASDIVGVVGFGKLGLSAPVSKSIGVFFTFVNNKIQRRRVFGNRGSCDGRAAL